MKKFIVLLIFLTLCFSVFAQLNKGKTYTTTELKTVKNTAKTDLGVVVDYANGTTRKTISLDSLIASGIFAVENPYYSIVGFINQDGTDAPTITITYNSIPSYNGFVGSRIYAGLYLANLQTSASISSNKVWYSFGKKSDVTDKDKDYFIVQTQLSAGNTNLTVTFNSILRASPYTQVDGGIKNVPFEIRIYK